MRSSRKFSIEEMPIHKDHIKKDVHTKYVLQAKISNGQHRKTSIALVQSD